MDWPKAKNVLIVGFLLLDLYLGYLLFYVPRVGSIQTTLTNADLEALVVLSQHFNVKLAARPRPMSVTPLPLLAIGEVSLNETLAADLAVQWLGEAVEEIKQENGLLFTNGQQNLVLSQESPYFYTLDYQDTTPPPNLTSYTRQEAVTAARDFLTEYLGETVMLDYQVNMAVAAPSPEVGYVIEISRTHRGVPVFLDSYRLLVQNGLVVSFTAKQTQIGETQRTSLPLVCADQVVRRYLARLGVPQEQEIVIHDLSLGYGIGVEAGQRQEIEPVWRFYLSGAEENEIVIPAAHVYWENPGE